MRSQIALILHAHLPFVRHPEHDTFLEEAWLFEAIAECYLPLLRLMDGWNRDRLPWRLTLTLTPTLCSMLGDDLLRWRFERHLASRLELAARERERHLLQPELAVLADFYRDYYRAAESTWTAIGRDVTGAFRRHADSGQLEILCCAATHAFLPLMVDHPASVRAQLLTARDSHRATFGRDPRGIWLPECGFAPGLDKAVHEAGYSHFILETHGLLHADPLPRRGVMAPILTPAGCAAFGRDAASARQVWSRQGGYPGDPRYREFHRDLVHDAERDYLRSSLAGDEFLGFSGFKYHRITSHDPNREKLPYVRAAALEAVEQHASHFLTARRHHGQAVAPHLDRPPLLVCPYDAELFGHWWFEGPEFLDRVVRGACATGSELELTTPVHYLERYPANQCATPSASSWGEGGHGKVWLNPKNAWMQPPLRLARERMEHAVQALETPGHAEPDALRLRALRQAGRELLLAQSSDWPFLITAGTAGAYARLRFIDHLANFERLMDQLDSGQIDEPALRQVEERHNLFPDLDLAPWRAKEPHRP